MDPGPNYRSKQKVKSLSKLQHQDSSTSSFLDSGIGVTSSPPPQPSLEPTTTAIPTPEPSNTTKQPETSSSVKKTDNAKPNQDQCTISPLKTTLAEDENVKHVNNESHVKTTLARDENVKLVNNEPRVRTTLTRDEDAKHVNNEPRVKSLSRKDKKILADEREIYRAQR